GFDVSGTNTYVSAGSFAITVDIADFGGGPGQGGSQPTLSVNNTAVVGTANQVFLFQVYLDLLNRPIDNSGLAFWGGQLDAGTTRQAVVQGIESSPEFRIREVGILYQH